MLVPPANLLHNLVCIFFFLLTKFAAIPAVPAYLIEKLLYTYVIT